VIIAKNGTDKVNGTVIRVPGVKEMYDYEREGYNVPMLPGEPPSMNRKITRTEASRNDNPHGRNCKTGCKHG
jgi:hypothetical protein